MLINQLLNAKGRQVFTVAPDDSLASIAALLQIMGHDRLLQDNPLLERSIRNRFPYLDPLNHVQIECLRRHRADRGGDPRLLRAIHLTINGVAAGLRNSG